MTNGGTHAGPVRGGDEIDAPTSAYDAMTERLRDRYRALDRSRSICPRRSRVRLAPMREVVVFARAPVLGTVKTRLAAGVGDAPALALYRHLLARTLARLASGDWRVRLCVTPDASAGDPDDRGEPAAAAAAVDGHVWPAGTLRLPQGVGDLGERMRRQLEPATPASPTVVVGSDIPGLRAVHVARAFEALASAPFVFGPAADGGFWLVGASVRPPASFLAGVAWSGPATLAEAVAGCPTGSAPAFVDTLADLDDAASLVAHAIAGTLGP